MMPLRYECPNCEVVFDEDNLNLNIPVELLDDQLASDPEILGLCPDCDEPVTEFDEVRDEDDEPYEDDADDEEN